MERVNFLGVGTECLDVEDAHLFAVCGEQSAD
jgi:hypothetical protein